MNRAVRWAAVVALLAWGGAACDQVTQAVQDNTAPNAVASASGSVIVGTTVTLDGSSSSDADGDNLTFSWAMLSQPSGSGATLTGASTASATFEADAIGTYAFELQVSDGTDTSADTVEVTATNTVPSPSAQPADTLVAMGDTVQLDGSGSFDLDGHTLTYSWSLESPTGSSATLSNPTSETPSFEADVEGDYLAILTVSDDWSSAMDTAMVTAVDPGAPPSIDATGTEGNIAINVDQMVYVQASDPDGNALTYTWTQVSGAGTINFPDSATAYLADTTNIQATIPGAYQVEIAVSDGFNVTTDTLMFHAYDPVLSSITQDTTIVKLLNSDYSSPSTVTVSGALTFEPGVVVWFGTDERLNVQTGGSLTAVGTATDTIRFLGEQSSPGYWDGLEFGTVDSNNQLDYVEVADGGSGGWSNVTVDGSGSVTITNSRIHNGSEYGVELETGASIDGFAANTLRNNAKGAVFLRANQVGQLDAASSYGDQSGDRVVIGGGTAVAAQTWPAIDIPYSFPSTTYIESAVTVAAGAEFRGGQDERLVVRNGGSLHAVGTMADTIRFVGEQSSNGYWDGIEILTTNAANELTYTEVGYGGSGGYGTVDIGSGGSVTITHSRIHNSSTAGITVASSGVISDFAENRFADNTQGALEMSAATIGSLDSMTVYGDGTTGHFIDVYGGTASTTQTWPKTDVPFQFNSTAYIEGAVTVQPGAWFEGGSDERLVVRNGGSLKAVGTANDTIKFVGIQDSPGYWDGIEFATVDTANQLVYTELANGGSGGWNTVYVDGSGELKLAHSLVRNSAGAGMWVETGGQLVGFSTNMFSGNQGPALMVPPEQLGSLDAASVYAGGNTEDYVATFGGTVTTAQTWPATDAPMRFDSDTRIQAAVTIQAGANLRVDQDDRLIVEGANGQLTAVGTASDSITILGLQAAAGYWDGLEIATANANSLGYVNIGYGGSGGWANIYVQSSGSVAVNNCTIHDSSTFGIEVESGGVLTGGSNTYSGNASGSTSP